MKFIVFSLQFIYSLEGLGMFFSSAALIRRLRRYAATVSQTVQTRSLEMVNDEEAEDLSAIHIINLKILLLCSMIR